MTSDGRKPRHVVEAVATALVAIGRGVYRYGTGDCDTALDDPSDCAGFAICQCYGLRRHRLGFNVGDWASVSDDLNCNSAIEDADHHRELFARAPCPAPGDLLAYPTFRLVGHSLPFIGHISIVVGVSRVAEWDASAPNWDLLDVVQCRGPNGHKPGIVASSGRHWTEHDRDWSTPARRSVLLRVAPRDGWR